VSVAVSAFTVSQHMECWVAGVYCITEGKKWTYTRNWTRPPCSDWLCLLPPCDRLQEEG